MFNGKAFEVNDMLNDIFTLASCGQMETIVGKDHLIYYGEATLLHAYWKEEYNGKMMHEEYQQQKVLIDCETTNGYRNSTLHSTLIGIFSYLHYFSILLPIYTTH